jgi:hypothetical protein
MLGCGKEVQVSGPRSSLPPSLPTSLPPILCRLSGPGPLDWSHSSAVARPYRPQVGVSKCSARGAKGWALEPSGRISQDGGR